MIQQHTVLIYHSKECKRDLPIFGDMKLEKWKTYMKFTSVKDMEKFKDRYSKIKKIPRNRIDFYYKNMI